MISAKKAYSKWAQMYDSNKNRTRDLELKVGKTILKGLEFEKTLEIGCGTGKNTEWLIQQSKQITAVDFSKEMLKSAKEKINSDKVIFAEADIKKEWKFANSEQFDLITFSLVLEHIKAIKPIFAKATNHLKPGGKIYVCELHPFKHLTGSQARYESEDGISIVESYCHHISEFAKAGFDSGLKINRLDEWFDDKAEKIPRLISLVFEKGNK